MNKKEKLIEEVLNSNLTYQGRIFQIIKKGTLDKIIKKVDNQDDFLQALNTFIDYFDTTFISLLHKNECISLILENQSPAFLLNKEYLSNIDKQLYNMKKTIVTNFYNNVLFIYNDIPYRKWDKFNISNNMNINSHADIDTLEKTMLKLIWSNIGNKQLYYLFKDSKILYTNMKPDTKDNISFIKNLYREEYENMIDNYIKTNK